jgi:hypothetical protein
LADVIRARVREVIEQTVEEELVAALGAPSYARVEERQGYRHGHLERALGTTVGPTTVALPRARLFTPTGESREWRSQIVRRYHRRMAAVDNAVVATVLAGTNTRRVRGALRPLLRPGLLSKSAVSRLVTSLQAQWEAWRDRPLREERYVHLYLDGFALAVRCGGRVVRLVVLAIVGVAPDGQKRLLALDLASSESQEAWQALLEGLVSRGLQPPLAATIEGCPGLRQALAAVWPAVHRSTSPHSPPTRLCAWSRCSSTPSTPSGARTAMPWLRSSRSSVCQRPRPSTPILSARRMPTLTRTLTMRIFPFDAYLVHLVTQRRSALRSSPSPRRYANPSTNVSANMRKDR